MTGEILIIDDNKSVLTALELLLQSDFEKVIAIKSPNSLISALKKNKIDVVLLDMNFAAGINTGNEGLFWLNEILQYDPQISVVMITAYGDIQLAVKAVKAGAFDFVLKPWDNDKLMATLKAALKMRKSRLEVNDLRKANRNLKNEMYRDVPRMIGRSDPMKKVLEMVKKVAVTDANVFITGENGTGKELIAREIHYYSKRNREMMVSVDMGAVSETLFESELFGHTKGAFTDAREDRTGKIELAHKGTLFLDEIGNLPLSLQSKILSVLQNRSVVKLGSNVPVPVDVRLITATNRDLHAMVAQGLFRQDLLYRINTITIELPPLRERGQDIILLAEYYLNKYARKYEKPGLKIADDARRRLLKYHWPGNVRELQHAVERAVILSESKILHKESFTLSNVPQNEINLPYRSIGEMERDMIRYYMKKEKGNMSVVAKKLGITRQTLYNKLKKYGISQDNETLEYGKK